MQEHSENFNTEMENIQKCQTEIIEVKNTITENFTRGAKQQTRSSRRMEQ